MQTYASGLGSLHPLAHDFAHRGSLEHVLQQRRVLDHRTGPGPEAPVGVDRADPLVEGGPLGALPGGVLALDLEDQVGAAGEADQEIGDVAAPRALPEVVDLEVQVVVLGVGFDQGAHLEQVGDLPLPAAVSDHVGELGLDRREGGLGGVPGPHVGRGADRRLLVEDRLEPLLVDLPDGCQEVADDGVDLQGEQDVPAQRVAVVLRGDHQQVR